MTRRVRDLNPDMPQGRCFTEFSVPVLVAGALALSAVLWLAIYAVI